MKRKLTNLVSSLAITAALSACAAPSSEDHVQSTLHPMDEDELLVLDPPEEYLKHLPDLGMEVIEVHELASVGDKLYHLRITDESHPHKGRAKHQERFPDVIVDVNHHHGHHARKVDKNYTAREAAKWTGEERACSDDIRIGVIDGNLDVKHPAFKGTKITYRSFHRKGTKIASSDHGTAVTATITGHAPWTGILPGAEIVAANVFHQGRKGQPIGGTVSIVRAIDWMVDMKVPIINMSIGGGRNFLIKKAVNHAVEQGVVIVASSGNDGPFSKKKSYPAAYSPVIAITSVDRDNRNARFATAGKYIDFATPGVHIWTAVPNGGKAMSGTSFSAPIFTAYAAAAMQHHGVKTTEGLRQYFQKYALDTVNEGHDKYTGWGVVQVNPICPDQT